MNILPANSSKRPSFFWLMIASAAILASQSVVEAQRPQKKDAKSIAASQNIDLNLEREEEIRVQNDSGTAPVVNVAEQYSELLSRDAILIEPAERGDPMIVPFIHDKVILEKWRENMEEAFANSDYSLAKGYAKQIANKYPDSDEAIIALQIISDIEIATGGGEVVTAGSDEPKIAPWVKSNLSAISYDDEDPIVLIGYETLRVGDSIPDYPNHVIDEIKPESVIFRVSNEFKTKRLELSVAGAGIQ